MRVKFVPEDMWIGLYRKRTCLGEIGASRYWVTTFYLCLIPCLPIIWKHEWSEH